MKRFYNLQNLATIVPKSGITILFLFQVLFCSAKQITKDQSLAIAKQFYSEQRTSKFFKVKSATIPDFKLDYIANDAPSAIGGRKLSPAAIDSVAYYYIYNVGENQGFVIVSGDDRTKPILGYSDEGRFASDNMPENIKAFLYNYKQQIKNVTLLNDTVKNRQRILKINQNDSVVAPLILTKWGQLSPYNSKIPLTGAPTGCVATAMAQIMNYHKWPIQGISSHSYTYNGSTYNANFENTKYDWANMKNVYAANEDITAIYSKAVGDLMYHCGVAVDMQYSSNGSNTTTDKIPSAFVNYFGYDKNVQLIWSKDFTTTQWKYKVKSEINAKRPILIFGSDGSIGHEYIADGYDKYNFIHINWGWDGDGNGYFETDPLDASIYFTPGSLIVGIQKPVTNAQLSLIYQGFNFNANTSYTRTQSIDKTITISEMSGKSFSGVIGLAFFKNENLYAIINSSITTISSGTTLSKNFTFTIPDSLTVGTYRLVPIFKLTNDNTWSEIKYKNTALTSDTRSNENIEFIVSKSDFIIYQNSKTMKCKKNDFKINFSFDDWVNIQRLVVSGQIDQFDLLYMAAAKSIKSIDIKDAEIIPTNINTIEVAYSGNPNGFSQYYATLSSKWKNFENNFWHGIQYIEGNPIWVKTKNGYTFHGLNYDPVSKIYYATCNYSYTNSQINIYTDGGQGLKIIGGQGLMADVFSKSNVESIEMPSNLKYIAPKAFANCPNLKTVALPDSVALIGDSLFYNCPNLTEIKFSKSIDKIWNQGLVGLKGLKNIVLPDSMTVIDDFLFQNHSQLVSVTLPSKLKTIPSGLFAGCTGLAKIDIPISVTSIKGGAFSGCINLASIILPASLTELGGGVFSRCSSLSSMSIPSMVTILSGDVFRNCTALKSISMNSVKYIDMNAFDGCISLTSMTTNAYQISSYAFAGCVGLKIVSLCSKNILKFDYRPFINCSSLSSLYIYNPDPELNVNSNTFLGIKLDKCILYVPSGSKYLYQNALYWKDFTNIVEFDPTSVFIVQKPNISIASSSANGLIEIKGMENPANVIIYNLQGREVLTRTVNPNEQISISSFPRGVYIVRVISKEGAFMTKLQM